MREFDPRVVMGSEFEMAGSFRFSHGAETNDVAQLGLNSRFHENGSRTYDDMRHREGCTPEVFNAHNVLRYEMALERYYLKLSERLARQQGVQADFYKLPHDYGSRNQSHDDSVTFGYHLSNLVQIPIETLMQPDNLRAVLPYLIASQVLFGTGRVMKDGSNRISSRSESFSTICNIDTTQQRPLINTRDEPLTELPGYHRVHLILFDVNRSEFQTYVKTGATALVFKLLEWQIISKQQVLPDLRYDLGQAITDFKALSRSAADWDLPLDALKERWKLAGVGNGLESNALDILKFYHKAVEDTFKGKLIDPDFDTVLERWKFLIDTLESGSAASALYLDWIAKRDLLRAFKKEEQVSYTSDMLRAQELEFARVAPRGVWDGHEITDKILTPSQVEWASRNPPPGRASARSELIRMHRDHKNRGGKLQLDLYWDSVCIHFPEGGSLLNLSLPDPHQEYPDVLDRARSIFKEYTWR